MRVSRVGGNGRRQLRWDTRVGSIHLPVPRVRDGWYFPSLFERRRRAERALVAVVQEAYVQGISTRRVDELVQTLGLAGMSKSQVSLLCQELDAEVERFRSRPLSGAGYPYVWLDATFIKGRQPGRVQAHAVSSPPAQERSPRQRQPESRCMRLRDRKRPPRVPPEEAAGLGIHRFPPEHCSRPCDNTPLERLTREAKRGTAVAGTSPHEALI